MTREEKLQAIDDMGVDTWNDCPSEFGLRDNCGGNSCENCWIESLEGQA